MQAVKICDKGNDCVHPKGPELILSEFYKRKDAHDGYRNSCKECYKLKSNVYYSENKEKKASWVKIWRQNNPDSVAAHLKRYYDNNRELLRARDNAYAKNNPGKMSAKSAKRHAAKLQRTPTWADLETIKQIYMDCEEINLAAKTAGCSETFVVDHEIPLQGYNVSGLHIESNLQIITQKANCEKSNSFNPAKYNV